MKGLDIACLRPKPLSNPKTGASDCRLYSWRRWRVPLKRAANEFNDLIERELGPDEVFKQFIKHHEKLLLRKQLGSEMTFEIDRAENRSQDRQPALYR